MKHNEVLKLEYLEWVDEEGYRWSLIEMTDVYIFNLVKFLEKYAKERCEKAQMDMNNEVHKDYYPSEILKVEEFKHPLYDDLVIMAKARGLKV